MRNIIVSQTLPEGIVKESGSRCWHWCWKRCSCSRRTNRNSDSGYSYRPRSSMGWTNRSSSYHKTRLRTDSPNSYLFYFLKNALYLYFAPAAQWGVATPHAPSGKFKEAAADVGTGVGNAVPVHEEQTVIQILVIVTAHVQAWAGRNEAPVITRHGCLRTL